AGPNDRVFELDPEAGILTFGDGERGRIPPLAVTAGTVVALRYRWGGGVAGEMDAGTINVSAAQFNGLAAVPHFVAAGGGRRARRARRRDPGDGQAPRAQGALHAQPRGHGERLRVDYASDADGARAAGHRGAAAPAAPRERDRAAKPILPTPDESGTTGLRQR